MKHVKGEEVKEFIDKVAVITGAASGISPVIADRCIPEGMNPHPLAESMALGDNKSGKKRGVKS